MALFKCKMCGGNLEIQENVTVCECEYCGSKQTVPSADNDKKINLFTRANRLRMSCEFDKAFGVYESIVADFQEEPEAYWGLILCKYGIEYVDDPKTGKKIPTCHRSSFNSIMDDPNFEMVMEYSDMLSRTLYREEAKVIEELRIRINEISAKEEPYDIFICYKETSEDGQRTIDSVIAQDVYEALIEKGYKVFFSRITLEDKLGQEYEPYIFAALNSAKVMLAFGTDYEYYNAVWVKNEWSRFLEFIEKGAKKTLIPCFKGIDAYDMPKEFSKLQAQDMGKVGAIQDLVRGVGKILGTNTNMAGNANVVNGEIEENVIEKVQQRLDEIKAKEKEEKRLKKKKQVKITASILSSIVVIISLYFAITLLIIPYIKYSKAVKLMESGKYEDAIEQFEIMDGYKDSNEKMIECNDLVLERDYNKGLELMESGKYEDAINQLEIMDGYKDSNKKIIKCEELILERDYNKGIELMESGKYGEAIVCFELLKNYKDCKQKIKDCENYLKEEKYVLALEMLEDGNIVNGYNFLVSLGGYKDCIEKAREIRVQYEKEVLKDVKVGDNFYFGYNMEWQVLDIKEGKALVISRYAYGLKKYNYDKKLVTWESCTLRGWLNNEFVSGGFTDEEITMIATTNVSADKNNKYGTDQGNLTEDKVFLLSLEEVKLYFPSEEDRICEMNSYGNMKKVGWWLRTSGYNQFFVSAIDNTGEVNAYGFYVDSDNYAVRPAMWINMEA